MPRYSKLSRSRTSRDALAITSTSLLDFLVPIACTNATTTNRRHYTTARQRLQKTGFEGFFFSALSRASQCPLHQSPAAGFENRRRHNGKAQFSSQAKARAMESSERAQLQEDIDVSQLARVRPGEPEQERKSRRRNLNSDEQRFASSTRLPKSFFYDVDFIRSLVPLTHEKKPIETLTPDKRSKEKLRSARQLQQQMKLLQSVRELEEKLSKAKRNLAAAAKAPIQSSDTFAVVEEASLKSEPVILTKEDYKNLVDLYFYSHNSRFSPESTDSSPNPLFLDDYSFELSSDFSKGRQHVSVPNEDENYGSLSQQIEKMLRKRRIKELSTMQLFVDLLLDESSSNRALFEAYRELPRPGVAHLPRGVIRLFLQRMSTPLTTSEKSMLRYLSLIDDMQEAKLPISVSEWSSAIYLAGRSFHGVTQAEVSHSFSIWREMEKKAGIQASHVTFNILFDIAVRAGRFALGETILKEMHARNLRLNRLGRVSLMYYHGLRGDGDGVRKAYHDFVEAGEIVDTLVLNCVIASLIHAQEPAAAEQIYQRMKDMHQRLHTGVQENEAEGPFKRYPAIGSDRLGNEMASNSLGRILEQAPHLREHLPDHHAQLQASMPLRPDIYTYRALMSYHAGVSGDLDRLTVLLNDMLEVFELPIHVLIFQFLFKGFAIHGPREGPGTKWSKKRLDNVWDACRNAIKASRIRFTPKFADTEPTLPSIREIYDLATKGVPPSDQPPHPKSPEQKLTPWQNLVLDLANFPKERIVRIKRFHSAQFDDEPQSAGHASSDQSFSSPYFQEAHYDAPAQKFDHEEGEFVLPNPVGSRLMDPTGEFLSQANSEAELNEPHKAVAVDSDDYTFNAYGSEVDNNAPSTVTTSSFSEDNPNDATDSFNSASQTDQDIPAVNVDEETPPHLIPLRYSYSSTGRNDGSQFDNPSHISVMHATRPMICWLLRAYARNTNDRRQVEEVWNAARKIWKPHDNDEKTSAIRVLHRCLRDCDRAQGSYWTDY